MPRFHLFQTYDLARLTQFVRVWRSAQHNRRGTRPLLDLVLRERDMGSVRERRRAQYRVSRLRQLDAPEALLAQESLRAMPRVVLLERLRAGDVPPLDSFLPLAQETSRLEPTDLLHWLSWVCESHPSETECKLLVGSSSLVVDGEPLAAPGGTGPTWHGPAVFDQLITSLERLARQRVTLDEYRRGYEVLHGQRLRWKSISIGDETLRWHLSQFLYETSELASRLIRLFTACRRQGQAVQVLPTGPGGMC